MIVIHPVDNSKSSQPRFKVSQDASKGEHQLRQKYNEYSKSEEGKGKTFLQFVKKQIDLSVPLRDKDLVMLEKVYRAIDKCDNEAQLFHGADRDVIVRRGPSSALKNIALTASGLALTGLAAYGGYLAVGALLSAFGGPILMGVAVGVGVGLVVGVVLAATIMHYKSKAKEAKIYASVNAQAETALDLQKASASQLEPQSPLQPQPEQEPVVAAPSMAQADPQDALLA